MTALDVIEAALAASEQKRWGDVPDRVAVAEWAAEVHERLAAAGLLLPSGTKSVEQFAARVLLDGEPVEAIPEPTTREFAEARVRAHERERTANPRWRGTAELVRRQRHTTPWEPVREQPARQRRGLDDLLEELGDARIQFWVCPIAGHSDRNGPDGRPVVTVEWRGDVAYCTAPGCGRNSQQTTKDEEAP